MKILAIQSSPNKDGLTSSLAQAALDGAAAAGAEVELVHLNSLSIKPCQACGTGWGHHFDKEAKLGPDQCIHNDDFAALREKIANADGLVFSTPVYFADLSESAKVFLDRLRRTHFPVRQESPFTDKLVVSIAAAGGSGNGAIGAAANLETYFLKSMGMKRVATFPATRQTKDVDLSTARQAGELLATTKS